MKRHLGQLGRHFDLGKMDDCGMKTFSKISTETTSTAHIGRQEINRSVAVNETMLWIARVVRNTLKLDLLIQSQQLGIILDLGGSAEASNRRNQNEALISCIPFNAV